MAFGTEEQQERFLPKILAVEELWAQGYSEPGAGSDLANVQTKARLRRRATGCIDGQKVWTSNAHFSQWLFVIARTEPGSERHHGLSFLLVPIDQDGVEVRPIEQLTGGSEFNEVFLTGARTAADLVVGEPGDGWRVAMGAARLRARRLDAGPAGRLRPRARRRRRAGQGERRHRRPGAPRPAGRPQGRARGDALSPRCADSRPTPATTPGGGGAASIFKLVWANWHKRLGEVAMDVRGLDGLVAAGRAPYDLDDWQRLFLFSRADTIYGGSDEVQRNILAERVLGLPREPKGAGT